MFSTLSKSYEKFPARHNEIKTEMLTKFLEVHETEIKDRDTFPT